jgi:hypothetical protein
VQVISNVLLLLCFVATALLFPLAADIDRLAGPDRSGAEIQFLMIMTPRWIMMAVVLAGLVASGQFGWVHSSRPVQWVTILGAHAVAGAVSLLALMMRGDNSVNPLFARYGWLAFSVAIPLCVMLYAGALRNPVILPGGAQGVLRGLAVSGVGISVAVAVVAIGVQASNASKDAKANQDAAYQAKLGELEKVPADAPLERYIDFTLSEQPGDIKQRAIRMMQARPDYATSFAALLRGPRSQEALSFLRYGLDQAPKEFAEPARDAILKNADYIRQGLAAGTPLEETSFDFECMQSIDVVEKFRGSGVDFVPAVRALKSAMDEVAAKDKKIGRRGRGEVERWLTKNAK